MLKERTKPKVSNNGRPQMTNQLRHMTSAVAVRINLVLLLSQMWLSPVVRAVDATYFPAEGGCQVQRHVTTWYLSGQEMQP